MKAHQADRRLLLLAGLRLGFAGGALFAATGARAQANYKVSAAQLQEAIATRFPRRYSANQLLDITLQAPQLRLMPQSNRLGAQIPVEAGGPALRRVYPGTFDLDLALRYEPRDLTIRAHELRVNSLQFEGLPQQTAALLGMYGPKLAEQALQGAVLHTLKPQDLALPDSMGLQPGDITVTAEGLSISFVPKPLG